MQGPHTTHYLTGSHGTAALLQVLATGAVLVDLPGVRDANAARGAIAEKYMKSCNAVWIVADITRAVDNRTAKVYPQACPACTYSLAR